MYIEHVYVLMWLGQKQLQTKKKQKKNNDIHVVKIR